MISFIRNVQRKHIYSDRTQMNSFLGLRVNYKWHEEFYCGDGNVINRSIKWLHHSAWMELASVTQYHRILEQEEFLEIMWCVLYCTSTLKMRPQRG